MRVFHLRKLDGIIILAVLLVGVAGLLVSHVFSAQKSAKTNAVANIYHENKIIKTMPLKTDTDFLFEQGEYKNLIRVRDGAVYIIEANCDGQSCVHTRPRSHTGEMIVCLPHRLIVEIKGGTESEVDAIAE